MKLYTLLGKLVVFFLGLLIIYGALAFLFCNIPSKRTDFLQLLSGNAFETGGDGQSLKRFREIQEFKDIDILFIGSSHAYRGFDPQVFSARGFSSFNMGSSSQTPLNSYYLLGNYLPRLKPKIIVFELYPVVLEIDGLESTFDLSANMAPSFEQLKMACCLRNPHAVTSWTGHVLRGISHPIAAIEQKKIAGETYCYGGYVKTDTCRKKPSVTPQARRLAISARQMCYIEKILRLARTGNIQVVGVIHPLPADTVSQYTNYDEVVAALNATFSRHGASFTDYNAVMHLDTIQDFKDDDHLNSGGVIKFNTALLDRLISEGKVANR